MAGNLGTLTLDLVARIGGFTAPLDQAQRHAQQRARAINGALASIGAGVTAAGIIAFAKSGIDALDNLNDLSLKTGAAVETLAGFDLAARQSGTSLESVGNALNKLSKNIATNREEFEKLGISAQDPTEAFLQFADVFNSVENAQDRAAFGAKALGKSYADLAPLLSLGSEELRRVVTEGQAASNATAELAKEADAFNDTLEVFKSRIAGVAIILGGSFASAINNLVDNITAATAQGNILIGVINGIGNAFAHKEILGGVAGQLQGVNEEIDKTQKKLNAIKNNGAIGGLIDDIVGNDATLEANRLDALFKKQENLANQLKQQSAVAAIKPAAANVREFIGAGPEQEKRIKSAGAARSSAMSDEQRAAEQLQHTYDSMLESLTKEIDLRGETSHVAKLQYEIINGGLKGISQQQSQHLLDLAGQQDALERQDKQWEALIESANEFYDIRKSTDELIRSGGVQEGFNEQLAKISDSDLGIDQKKEQFDKLGVAFNDQFIQPAVEGTDKLSEYAIQAARNIETSFADFLFDPFKDGLEGLVDNFATTLRRMAADYLSSSLFDLLKSGVNSAGGGEGIISSLIGGVSSFFGGAGSAVKSANGNVFSGGNVVPFANGGVFGAPAFFPMSGGKTGLLGEAGPEAIMPLSRGPDGKLGIKGGSTSGSNVNITVNVNGNNAPDVRRAASQGAREAMGFLSNAQRYV
jgi:hypothetical protein